MHQILKQRLYTATVTADDGNGNTTSQDITVWLYESSKDDTSPGITSGPYTVTEGSTSVGIVEPITVDVTFTVGGSELVVTKKCQCGRYSTCSAAVTAKDSVTVTADDGLGNTTSTTVTVSVDYDESGDTSGPVFLTSTNFTVSEGESAIGIIRANDPSGDVTFTISGSEMTVTEEF